MPESWQNMPTVMARKTGNLYRLEKSGSANAERSRWTEAMISWRSSSGFGIPVRRSTASASSFFIFIASQRGLRGIPKSAIRKKMAGSPEMPNCQRHSCAPRCMVPITKFDT